MSEAIAFGERAPSRQPLVGRWFYLFMSLFLVAIVVFGFSHTVPFDLAAPDFPVMLMVHAGVFTAWIVLFVAQPALVVRGSLRLHRRLGWLGAGLAVAMVLLGLGAVMMALWADHVPDFYPHGLFLARGVLSMVLFGGLVGAGVALHRQGEWHKRLMLCASIVVMVPGLERGMPIPLFGAVWPIVVDGVVDLLALAGPAVDLLVRGRVHPAYLWGVGAIVGTQLVVDALAFSPVAPILLRTVGTH